MKTNCRIIEDLLPLYIDKVCSNESSALIENHLQQCSGCKEKLNTLKSDLIVTNDMIQENLKAKKPFKKIFKVWFITTFFIILIAIPLLFLTFIELTGDGIGFSALSGKFKTEQFLSAVEKEAFEKAAEYVEFAGGTNRVVATEEEWKTQWISQMEKLKDDGLAIVSHRKNRIHTDDGFTSGNVIISVRYYGEIYEFELWISTNSGKVAPGSVHLLPSIQHHPSSKVQDMLIQRISDAICTYDPG